MKRHLSTIKAASGDSVTKLLVQADRMKEDILAIEASTKECSLLHHEWLRKHDTGLAKKLTDIEKKTTSLIFRLQKELESVKPTNNFPFEEDTDGVGAEERIRDNIHRFLQKKIQDAGISFTAQSSKQHFQRESEASRLVSSLVGGNCYYHPTTAGGATSTEEMLIETVVLRGHDELFDTLEESNVKLDASRQLAASVQELNRIFVDMTMLAESQGEALDCIEHQIQVASRAVGRGNAHLSRALWLQRSIRKLKWRIKAGGLLLAVGVGLKSPVMTAALLGGAAAASAV